jgi:hypothetical protein
MVHVVRCRVSFGPRNQQQDNPMTSITRRELLLTITAVAVGCRAAPRSAIVTLAVDGMI